MENPCRDCKMKPESKAACCGCPERLKYEKEHRKKPIWIIDGHHIRCGMCGAYMCDTDREGDFIPRNFCPNCGEKMLVEDKDDG